VQMDQLLAGLQGDRIHQELTLGLVRGGQLQSLKIIVSENL